MTALYVERYLNFGLSLDELQGGRPIIGIAQSGSDLVPCNRHHLQLAERVRAGIIEAGGVPLEFPTHPLAAVWQSSRAAGATCPAYAISRSVSKRPAKAGAQLPRPR